MSQDQARATSDEVCDDLFGSDSALEGADDIGGKRDKCRPGQYRAALQAIVMGEQKKKDDQPFLVFEWEIVETIENRSSVDYHTQVTRASQCAGEEVSNFFDLSKNRKGWSTGAKYNIMRIQALLAALFSEPDLGETLTGKQMTVADISKAVKKETQAALVGSEIILDITEDSKGFPVYDAWHPASDRQKAVVDAREQVEKRSAVNSTETPF